MAKMQPASAKLETLRNHLKTLSLTGFLVPKSDAFLNESVPPQSDRLRFLTGFTGSSGIAVVLQDRAAVIVDSRYTIQAKAEIESLLYSVELWPKVTAPLYLAQHVQPGGIIGYDPALHTLASFKPLQAEADKKGFRFQSCAENPIDKIWQERPQAAYTALFTHDIAYAGETAGSKLARVREVIQKQGADGLMVSAADSVAWLFNIRAWDVLHTPLPLCRAYIPLEGDPILFVQHGHVTEKNEQSLKEVARLERLSDLEQIVSTAISKEARVMVDPSNTTLSVADALKNIGALLVENPDPCQLLKSKKNATEREGAKQAHARDGVALCRFLCWLDANAHNGMVDELQAAGQLRLYRQQGDLFEGESFDTISAAGANGAIVHYRATPASNKPLGQNSLYLIDSGGQYRDGTTDVTRTVAIGKPTAEMRKHFTLVLKGHIALSTVIFPPGTRGVDLEVLARRALWAAGLDYGHGTGHGVGSFLSVHEGPAGLSRNAMVALEPGMILSNEPGFYKEGHYGIRIETLLLVGDLEAVAGGETAMLGFETLTLAPIDKALIETALLSPDEKEWLDSYHVRIYREIAPALDNAEKEWLSRATAPLI